MSITTLATLLIIYGFGLYLWIKKTTWRLDEIFSRTIRYIHYSLTLLVVISIAIKWFDNLSFSGQWTTRITIVGFLLTGIFIYPVTNWVGKIRIEKLYFRLFSFLPTLFGFLLLIPYTGGLVFGILIGQLMYPVNRVYFNNDKLRVQSSYIGPVWPSGIFVYQKKGLLEKQLVESAISDLFIDSVGVTEKEGKTLIIFYDEKDEAMDTLRFEGIE